MSISYPEDIFILFVIIISLIYVECALPSSSVQLKFLEQRQLQHSHSQIFLLQLHLFLIHISSVISFLCHTFIFVGQFPLLIMHFYKMSHGFITGGQGGNTNYMLCFQCIKQVKRRTVISL